MLCLCFAVKPDSAGASLWPAVPIFGVTEVQGGTGHVGRTSFFPGCAFFPFGLGRLSPPRRGVHIILSTCHSSAKLVSWTGPCREQGPRDMGAGAGVRLGGGEGGSSGTAPTGWRREARSAGATRGQRAALSLASRGLPGSVLVAPPASCEGTVPLRGNGHLSLFLNRISASQTQWTQNYKLLNVRDGRKTFLSRLCTVTK